MNTEEMIQFKKLIEENCELKDTIDWQRREIAKGRAVMELVERNSYTYKTPSDVDVVEVYDTFDGDDAIKLLSILNIKRR